MLSTCLRPGFRPGLNCCYKEIGKRCACASCMHVVCQRRNDDKDTVVLVHTTTTVGRASATVVHALTTNRRASSQSSLRTPLSVISSWPPSVHCRTTFIAARRRISADIEDASQRALPGPLRLCPSLHLAT